MFRKLKMILCLAVGISLIFPFTAYARVGDSGYEGGISSGESPGKTLYDYQEVTFLSGEPIVFKGTLQIKKSLKQSSGSSAQQSNGNSSSTLTAVYTYNLKNTDKSATLTRVITLSTKLTKKENGQTVEETTLPRVPSESIRIGNVTYTLKNYDFSRTNIIDAKPAINYFAGNTWGRKTYQMTTGTAAGTGTITVEETGEFYGYDQYWGTTEAQVLSVIVQSEQKSGGKNNIWGGTADVKLSSTTTKQVEYMENIPNQISFDGGYVQKQHNEGILEYGWKGPEFDKNGMPTTAAVEKTGSLKLESFPVQTRLVVPDISSIRGHWAENDIKLLYSLEVFSGNDSSFKPEAYITRGEFASAIASAARDVPEDPALAGRTTARTARNTSKVTVTSPFNDISIDNTLFDQINSVYKKGLMLGVGNGSNFSPNGYLTVSDAVSVFIKALGLESMAPNPAPVTTFADNDKIPSYARKAFYVAEKIGLVEADSKGYINPAQKLTKAKAAMMISQFIEYMQDGIRKDYRDRIVNY